MIYREYTDSDISYVRDILEKDLGYACDVQKLKNRIDEMLRRGNYIIFVACDGDKVVGFVGCVSYYLSVNLLCMVMLRKVIVLVM